MKLLQIFDKLQSVYNMEESGFHVNNRPPKLLSEDEKRMAVSLARWKGENITILLCYNASGMYTPPMAVFKEVTKLSEFKNGFPPGSAVEMSNSS
jgi:hypothetical protein